MATESGYENLALQMPARRGIKVKGDVAEVTSGLGHPGGARKRTRVGGPCMSLLRTLEDRVLRVPIPR